MVPKVTRILVGTKLTELYSQPVPFAARTVFCGLSLSDKDGAAASAPV